MIYKKNLKKYVLHFFFISFPLIVFCQEVKDKKNNQDTHIQQKHIHKYIIEIENFDEFLPLFKEIKRDLKHTYKNDKISFSKNDNNLILICNEECSKTIIRNLKKLISDNGFRLYKVNEILIDYE